MSRATSHRPRSTASVTSAREAFAMLSTTDAGARGENAFINTRRSSVCLGPSITGRGSVKRTFYSPVLALKKRVLRLR